MQRRSTDPSEKPRRNARADQRSPSNASAGSSSSVSKNNTNRIQDPNALESRLKQLDDCMRQVKSLMKNLEKSGDPGAHGHLQRLRQMMQHLNAEQESSNAHSRRYNALDQRQRRLEARAESPAHNAASQAALNLADSCVDDDDDDGNMRNDLDYPPPTRDDEENLMQQNAIMRKILESKEKDDEENLMQQNAIMRKIVESKKKLLELQDQHARLASMQKKAENKLAETRAFQEQLALNNPDLSEWVNQIQRESAAGTLINPTLASREPKRSTATSGAGRRTQQQQHRGVSDAEVAGGDSNWMWTADTCTAGGATSAEAELKRLERRLHQLQGMAQQQGILAPSEGPSAVDLSDSCQERRRLQERLKELHDQKVEMDQLLSELSLIQSAGSLGTVAVGHVDVGSRDDAVPNGPSNESGSLDHPALRDKKRQVDEMRKTLQQLRSAVKNLDLAVPAGTVTSVLEGATGTAMPQRESQHSHGPRGGGGTGSHKTDNLRGDFPARRHYEAEGRANEEPDLVAGGGAVATATVPSSGAQVRSEGDLLAEKVRQLQATRSQLQYLQGIVTTFQEADLDGNTAATNASTSPGGGDQRRQRRELQELQEQQLRLTLLRQQLLASHPLLATGGKNQLKTSTPDGPRRLDVSPRGGGEASGGGGHLGPSASPSKKDNVNALPKNLFEAPKSSNRAQDHSSNLECSGGTGSLLREKAILEELLQQERSKQLLSYSHNEDVRTSPSSGSQSSEPLGGPESVIAGGNTTIAATWGGSSTQENLEDDEDDEDPVEDSIEAGRDSEEGSRSDMDMKAEPPWIPARERVLSVPDSNASLGRTDNRLSHGSLTRAVTNGVCNRPTGGQWGYNQAAAGPIHRQGPSHREAPVEAVSPQVATDEQDGAGERVPGVSVFPGWHQQAAHHLHQQLEQTGVLCNSVLQEHQQQAFTGALLATSAGAVSPGSTQPRLPGFDAVQQYAVQQQQQLLLSIVHCYHLLSIQQLEINQLQHAIQQACLNGSEEAPATVPPTFQLPEHPLPAPLFLGAPWAMPPVGPGGVLAQGMPVPQQTSSHAVSEARGGPPPGATLNNQVVPGSRANNFWDNFRSYSRQNLLSTSATTPPKTNELPANFQVQQLAGGRSPTASASGPSRPKQSALPRTVAELTAIVPPIDRSHHMRPVANVSLQDASARATGGRLNIGKQQQPTGFQDGAIPTAVTFPYSPSPPSRCRQPPHSPPQQQAASEVLKSSIRAEVSRLLEGREDTASLAAVLRQLQFLNCGAAGTQQQPSGAPQACGGARRKVPSSTKSNIPKENRLASGERRPVFQRVASESSPDLVTSVEFAFDSRPRPEETLSDSTFDKNTSRGSASLTTRKRTKPLYAPTGPPSLPGSSSTSAERNVPAEHLVPERDCATDEEQGAAARPLDLEPTLEQTWPERDTTVYVQPLDLLPSSNEAAAVEIQVPVLDNAAPQLLPEPVGAVRAGNSEFQAMCDFELALLQQGVVAGGEYQGEEAEDDEDRELETEPEAEGTQDLAEADQSPAAEQDAADQQPEDAAAGAVASAALGAVGGADGGQAEAPVADDGTARQAASRDTPEVPPEDPQQRVVGEDNPIQHDSVPQPPPYE